jgi:hypothetical protein
MIPTILRERFLHLSLSLVGLKVVVTRTNGSVLEGIFHTSTPFPSLPSEMTNMYVFKACKMIKPPTSSSLEGEPSSNTTFKEGSTVVIPADSVLFIHAKGLNLDARAVTNGGAVSSNNMTTGGTSNINTDMFRTDTEISGGQSRRNRDLVAAGSAWTAGGGKSLMALGGSEEKGGRAGMFGTAMASSSSSAAGLRGTIGEWDQFRANQELFNINATFDENLYTTELDKSSMDARKIAEAERIAREIENTTSSNIHVAEERGHVLPRGDYDEEDLYSGVLTIDGKQRHDEATTTSSNKPKESLTRQLDGASSSKPAPSQQPPKKMNYAAAAKQQADATNKSAAAPPGFARPPSTVKPATAPSAISSSTELEEPVSTTAASAASATELSELSLKDKADSESTVPAAGKSQVVEPVEVKASSEPATPPQEGSKDSSTVVTASEDGKGVDVTNSEEPIAGSADGSVERKDDVPPPAPAVKTSKLNAAAKPFTLNATAKSFSPSFGSAPQPMPQPLVADPGASMHMPVAHNAMQAPHYMHGAPMGQPGKSLLGVRMVVRRYTVLTPL